MKLYLSYDEATTLAAILEAVDSEALDTVYRRLTTEIFSAWNSGNTLTPMFTPFIIQMAGDLGTRVVVRTELCNTYAPEHVNLTCQGTGELLSLDAKSFKWRHM